MTQSRSGDGRRRRALDRPWLGWLALAALIAVAVFMFGRTLLPRTYFGFALDPSAANVVPNSGADHATLETSVPPNTLAPGLEGAVLFVRLVDPQGQTALDRPFEWPADSQAIPPGSYALTTYWRGCDGSCSRLSAESDFCQADVVAAPGSTIKVKVVPSWHCTISGG